MPMTKAERVLQFARSYYESLESAENCDKVGAKYACGEAEGKASTMFAEASIEYAAAERCARRLVEFMDGTTEGFVWKHKREFCETKSMQAERRYREAQEAEREAKFRNSLIA